MTNPARNIPPTMRNRIRRRIEWYLTTDFDPHEPVPRPTVHAILIILTIIYVWGGLK